MSWPSALPPPTVSGSTATYKDVLPGVDLSLTADAQGGVSEVLVVHTAAAASNPAVQKFALSISTNGLRLAQTSTGSLTASSASGVLQYVAPPAQMWDSTTNPSVPNPSPSSISGPGLGANVGLVPVSLSGSTITVTPSAAVNSQSQSMLTAATTTYPVFIDPDWQYVTPTASSFDQVKSGAPCNGVSEYNDLGGDADSGQMGNGYNGFAGGCDGVERGYYQFAVPAATWGTHIGSAVFKAYEIYSASCSAPASTVGLFSAGLLNSGTDWNNQSFGSSLSTTSIGPACTSNPAAGLDMTADFASAAASNATQIAVALAGDEHPQDDVNFKRFCAPGAPSPCSAGENPTLTIQYDTYPARPTSGELTLGATSSGTTLACDTNSNDANLPVLGNTSIVLSAVVSKTGGGSLTNYFTIVTPSNSVQRNSAVTANSGSRAVTPTLPLNTFWSPAVDGAEYGWNVYSTDGVVNGPPTANCWFKVDGTPPKYGPTVTSTQFPNDDAVAAGATPGPTGVAGQFSFCPGSGSTGIVSYTYWFGSDQSTQKTVNAPTTNGCAVITATPTQATEYTLQAVDKDQGANVSPPGSDVFPVVAAANNTEIRGDLNSDQKPDIVTTRNTSNLYYLQGTGNGGLSQAAPIAIGGWSGALTSVGGNFISQTDANSSGALVDTSLDGYQDLVAWLPSDPTHLWVYPGNGIGGIDTNTRLSLADPDTSGAWPSTITQVLVGDFTGVMDYNGNPVPDIIVVEGTTALLYQWDYNGQITGHKFTLAPSIALDASTNWSTVTLTDPGDLNADQVDDLWARNNATGALTRYDSEGGMPAGSTGAISQTGGAPTTIGTGVSQASYPYLYSYGDLTGDGLPDLWLQNASGGYDLAAGQAGNPALAAPQAITVSGVPTSACPASIHTESATPSSTSTGWPASNTYDDNPASAWSSAEHATANASESLAFWGTGFANTDYVTFWPRTYNGAPEAFPTSFTLYYSSGSGWTPVPGGTFTNFPALSGSGPIAIPFGKTVSANGFQIVGTVLSTDGNAGHYYFQLAEADAACTMDI